MRQLSAAGRIRYPKWDENVNEIAQNVHVGFYVCVNAYLISRFSFVNYNGTVYHLGENLFVELVILCGFRTA